ncbi:NUDIX domain-containing protein [Schaalia sp. HMT-172]|uniref:NUDIX domain-containing protein n=2 Tax=Actinomycetaceae TaxID=2049 RepID=UPI00272AC94B|nr:NUDIX domain-containing protein [Schaalia sp. HMT-172]WLD79096.1 NUDIX domain-containing protein [Schaalia sp. HMT-172]
MPAPRPQRLVRSAGALVWRFADPTRVARPGEPIDPADIEVLMVHRPRYHDWSWPKGKAENGEPLLAAAVREVEEETGQIITLGAPLTTQRYRLGGGQTKEVHYWVGTPLPADAAAARLRAPAARAPRTEIDQTRWASPEAASDMLTRRGDRRLLADLVARASEGRLVTSTILILRPGPADTAPESASASADAPAPAAPATPTPATPTPAATATVPAAAPKPRPVPSPAIVASAAARRAAQVERASALTTRNAQRPDDPPLGRFGVRQAFDLVDLLSAFGVDRAFASPSARARQALAPWAALGGGSVTLVDALGTQPEAAEQIDADARAGRVRAFAAQRLREPGGTTLVSVTGAARDLIVEELRAYGANTVAGGDLPTLKHSQILVAHVELGADGPLVVALETHGVTTKNPAIQPRKASKKH